MPNNELLETTKAYLPELKKRKKKYILKKHLQFKNKYNKTINEISNEDEGFNLIIYSILIFENFNRPRIIRWTERIWVRLTKQKITQGIMQIASKKCLSDLDSIRQGSQYLYGKYSEYKMEKYVHYLFRRTIKRHCPDKKYIRQILFIAKSIIDDTREREKYSNLFEEIKSEFELYDYYD